MDGDSTDHSSAPRGEVTRESLGATAMEGESTTSSLAPHGEVRYSVSGQGPCVSDVCHDVVKVVTVFQPGGAGLEFSFFEGDG